MRTVCLLLIPFTQLIAVSNCYVMHLDESTLQKFLSSVRTNTQSSRCLQQENDTQNALYELFTQIMIGYSDEFLSEDRWVHKMLACLASRTDSSSYCYGYMENDDEFGNAFGFCIPENCTSEAETFLHKLIEVVVDDQYIKVKQYHCINGHHEQVWYQKAGPLIVIFIVAIAALAVLVITVFHKNLSSNHSMISRILLAFSLRKNSKKLYQFPKSSNTITCMVGLRVIAMIWVLLGHNFAWIQAFIENVDDFKDDIANNLSNIWITNFSLAVDIFFILSATLTAYNFSNDNLTFQGAKRSKLRSIRYWYTFYSHRLVRLWPAYFVTVALATFLLSAMYKHPTWPPIDPAIQCRRYWWHNVLFLNSIYGSQCIGWTWFIGTEFVLFFFSPLLLLLMTNSITLIISLVIIAMICALSGGYITYMMVMYGYPPVAMPFRQPITFDGNFIQHTTEFTIRPQYHAGVYVVGLLLGYVITAKQKFAIPECNIMDERTVSILYFSGWVLCTIFLSWSILGLYPIQQGWNMKIYYLIYGATSRLTWAYGIAWLIYACHNGYGGFINKFLSSKKFIPLSTLSYSMYLLHMIVQYATFLWMPFPFRYHSKWPLFLLCMLQLLLTFIAAYCLAVIIEFPIINLEKIYRKHETETDAEVRYTAWILRQGVFEPATNSNIYSQHNYRKRQQFRSYKNGSSNSGSYDARRQNSRHHSTSSSLDRIEEDSRIRKK